VAAHCFGCTAGSAPLRGALAADASPAVAAGVALRGLFLALKLRRPKLKAPLSARTACRTGGAGSPCWRADLCGAYALHRASPARPVMTPGKRRQSRAGGRQKTVLSCASTAWPLLPLSCLARTLSHWCSATSAPSLAPIEAGVARDACLPAQPCRGGGVPLLIIVGSERRIGLCLHATTDRHAARTIVRERRHRTRARWRTSRTEPLPPLRSLACWPPSPGSQPAGRCSAGLLYRPGRGPAALERNLTGGIGSGAPPVVVTSTIARQRKSR